MNRSRAATKNANISPIDFTARNPFGQPPAASAALLKASASAPVTAEAEGAARDAICRFMAGDGDGPFYKPLVTLLNGPDCSVANALATDKRQTCYIKRVSWEPIPEWTGFADIDMVKAKIEGLEQNEGVGTLVIVDETDLVWYGDDWRGESVSLDRRWVSKMLERGIDVWVVTAIGSAWNGNDLSVGWAVAPSEKTANPFGTQTLSSRSLAFISAAYSDDGYYLDTQRVFVENIRKDMVARAKKDGLDIWGAAFLPVVFVDMGSSRALAKFLNLARERGYVLEGTSPEGYLRIAVHVFHGRVFDLLSEFRTCPAKVEKQNTGAKTNRGASRKSWRAKTQ